MRALVLVLFGLLAGANVALASPQRIVSINLCTDILALDLSSPGTLKSVFRVAADASDSPVADKAENLPLNNATAEDIMSYKPDLVLAHAYSSPFTLKLLKQANIPVVQIKDAASFADVRSNVRTIADAMGVPEKGEAIIARFDAVLAASARPMRADAPRAVIYQDLGGAAAADTILGALLTHTGFKNVITAGSSGGFVNLTIEDLINTRPQFVAIGIYRPLQPSLAHEVLSHPALKAYVAAHARSLNLPAKLWTCGSPYVAGIATALAAARDTYAVTQ
ncbi:MAG: ABC transporter substrate-binding protein [Pseudomonadota bacterium]